MKILALFLTAAASLGLVQTVALAKAQSKYGVVDMQRVILTVNDGKTARSDLEKEIKAKEAEFLTKKKELDKMNEEWKTQAPLLSEQARFDKQKEFQEKFIALRQQEANFKNSIKQKEQQATQKIAIKVAGIVEQMAKDMKLEMVFETSTSGLLYLKTPIDLTPEVIAKYNGSESGANKKNTAKK